MVYGNDIAMKWDTSLLRWEHNPSKSPEKEQYDAMPVVRNVFWETAGGNFEIERMQPIPSNPISNTTNNGALYRLVVVFQVIDLLCLHQCHQLLQR